MADVSRVLNTPQATGSIPASGGKVAGAGEDFRRLLAELGGSAGIRFSKHAVQRMKSRGISLDKQKISKLDAAVNAASNKGAKESLVLMDELALVVSVRNRTVITAMSSNETRGNIFTSIDSTVIA
jgi:flagellar operon protein